MAAHQRKYSDSDLALAYELSQEGCQWKLIGLGLGIDYKNLYCALKRRLENRAPEVRHG